MYSDWSWSRKLHYIDVKDNATEYIRKRDCLELMCVDGAVQNYTNRLYQTPTKTDLKFLIHYIGDIYQPLHCAFTKDRGGNEIFVKLPINYQESLHGVWDSAIIQYKIKNVFQTYQNWTDYLMSMRLTHHICELNDYLNGICTENIAKNSFQLALNYAYKATNMTELSPKYIDKSFNIINHQLLSGGVSLSLLLNSLFN